MTKFKKLLKVLITGIFISVLLIGCSLEIDKSAEKEKVDVSNKLEEKDKGPEKAFGNRGTSKAYLAGYHYIFDGTNYNLCHSVNYSYNSDGSLSAEYEYDRLNNLSAFKFYTYTSYQQMKFISTIMWYNKSNGGFSFLSYDYSQYPSLVKKNSSGADTTYREFSSTNGLISENREYAYAGGQLRAFRDYYYTSSNYTGKILTQINNYNGYNWELYGYTDYKYDSNNVVNKSLYYSKYGYGDYTCIRYSLYYIIDYFNYAIQYTYNANNQCTEYIYYTLDPSRTNTDFNPFDPTSRYNL